MSIRVRLLLLVFILSGFSGLIYQSVWSQYLGLFLGHAAYAQSLVLAIFMGGMAAGAALAARYSVRYKNLILGYAIVELIIGVLALFFHYIFTHVVHASYSVVFPAIEASWISLVYKWGVSALLIVPQTILLGMTFPLMCAGILRQGSMPYGKSLGGLYFANSLGAAAGVLISVFVIVPAVGIKHALWVAGVLNIIVFCASVLIALKGFGQPAEMPPKVSESSSTESRSENAKDYGRGLLNVVLWSTLLSGAASFAYEIIWVRMISLAVGNTIHSFELMLAAFVAGIALGGYWVRNRADRSSNPMGLVGWLQLYMGLAAVISIAVYSQSFTWVAALINNLADTDGGYALFNLGTAGIAVLVMIPAAFFAGTTLPLYTVALLKAGQSESAIGRVYAWNTVGAIFGVFAAVHILIPALGLKLSLAVSALLDIGLGLYLLNKYLVMGVAKGLKLTGAVVVSLLCVGTLLNKVELNPLLLSSGVYRHGDSGINVGDEIGFYRDGKTASVSTIVNPPSGIYRIATNGKVDASVQMTDSRVPTADEPTMVLAGALPMGYVKNPELVGVIGFGSGLTTHTVLSSPGIKRVDTIEIEQAMIDGARFFGRRVSRAYEDERSNIVIDDAKSYFSSSNEKYDFIVSEPSNPWISGVGTLFSKEFYQLIPQFLEEDGVFVQWLQLYEINNELVGNILSALTPSFDDYHAYMTNDVDLIIIAKPNGQLKDADFSPLFQAEMAKDLRRVGVGHEDQLRFRQVADARMLRALTALYGAEPNSDYFPLLSLNAPKARFKRAQAIQADMPDLKIPLLEYLGVSDPLPMDVELGFDQHFSRTASTREIRAMLYLGDEYLSDAQLITKQFETAFSDCDALGSLAGQIVASVRLLEVTERLVTYIPQKPAMNYLDVKERLDCTNLPVVLNRQLAISRSLIERDHRQSITLLQSWLGDKELNTEIKNVAGDYYYMMLALSLAAEDRAISELPGVEEYEKYAPESGDMLFVLSLLNAWLDTRDASISE